MINVQDVFDQVINSGHYSPLDGSELMCHALKAAGRNGDISSEDFILAKEEIRSYLGGFGSLGGFLDYKGLPYDFNARLAIYLNWKNRPTFDKG